MNEDLKKTILSALPCTVADASAAADISIAGAYRIMQRLANEGAVHIGRWDAVRGAGRFAAIYVLGAGQSAPKPMQAPKKGKGGERRPPKRQPPASAAALLHSALHAAFFPRCAP